MKNLEARLNLMREMFLEEERKKNLAEATIEKQKDKLNVLFRFLDVECSIADAREVRREHLLKFLEALRGAAYGAPQTMRGKKRDASRGRPFSKSYQYEIIQTTKQFFLFLEKSGQIILSPAKDIELKAPERAFPKDILTEDEVKAILEAPDTNIQEELKQKAILEILYGSGLRSGEVRNLKLSDVDMENGFLYVKGKGGKDRVVPMTKASENSIREYLAKSRSAYFAIRPDEENLFLGSTGKPLGCWYIGKMVNKFAEAVGLTTRVSTACVPKKISPHSFRHTCATHLLVRGAGLRYVQELLGHSDIDTTQIYTRVMPVNLQKVYEETHPRGSPRDASRA